MGIRTANTQTRPLNKATSEAGFKPVAEAFSRLLSPSLSALSHSLNDHSGLTFLSTLTNRLDYHILRSGTVAPDSEAQAVASNSKLESR